MFAKGFSLILGAFASVIVAVATPSLPQNLKWETNDTDPVFASPKAEKGGTFRIHFETFPMTLRTVGPDSNGSFRGDILGNVMSLVDIHPNTENVIPSIASHWAFSPDRKGMYFKIDKRARWSDGKPVTAADVAFVLDFMRSKNIKAPWYNTFYTEQLDKVEIFDDHTVAVWAKDPKPKLELVGTVAFSPIPKHFFGGKVPEDFVRKYNWTVIPNTGPYIISDVKKGKSVTFKRKKDWWAKDDRYNKNRYNVDKVVHKLIRDKNIAFEHVKKGQLDALSMLDPNLWNEKSKTPEFENGYVRKIWFYVDTPQPNMGIWLNTSVPLLKDKNIREGILHSFNIQKVLDTVLRGEQMRAETVSMGYGEFTNKDIKARRFDIKKANAFFDKAGWSKRGPDGIRVKDGKKLSFRITYGYGHHKDRLTILKEEAKKTGLELSLQLLDPNASFKTMLEKKHEIAYTGWGPMMRPQYWGIYHSENADKPQTNNFGNVKDKALDREIEKYRKAMTKKERAQLARKIQKMIHDLAVTTPTFLFPYVRSGVARHIQFPDWIATKSHEDLTQFYGMAGGMFWIDKKMKEETEKGRKSGKKFDSEVIINKKYKMI